MTGVPSDFQDCLMGRPLIPSRIPCNPSPWRDLNTLKGRGQAVPVLGNKWPGLNSRILVLPRKEYYTTNTCTHPTSRQVQSQTSLNKVKQRHKQCQNRRVGDGLITRLQTQNATRNPTEEQLAVSSLIRTVVVDERTDQKCGAHILTLFVNPASDFVRDLSHPE